MEKQENLCIGDFVCLYSEATRGYVNSWQTSDSFRDVYVHNEQDRDKPDTIKNPHMVVFQVTIQNRYKLNKHYRKLQEALERDPDNSDLQAEVAAAKVMADAETGDNRDEQASSTGDPVMYGDIVQLKHMFTGKYIHVSGDQTSSRDKNNLKVFLHKLNAKNAQLKILSNYCVKEEGQPIQFNDQIVIESVKSPGQCFHASAPFQIDRTHYGSEVNLGVDSTGFTLVKYYRPVEAKKGFIRGGSIIQLYHKVLEANLNAEGLFDHELTEDVHLHIRRPDPQKPHTLDPSTSAISYWQVIDERSIIKGDVLCWGQQVQFRHMTTGLYLCVNRDHMVCMRRSGTDPDTVFRLHPITKESDEIPFASFARIEHVLHGCWLHGEDKTVYHHHGAITEGTESSSVAELVLGDGPFRKISAIKEKQFSDAFMMPMVTETQMENYYYVAGSVPLALNVLWNQADRKPLTANFCQTACNALTELREFMMVQNSPSKVRQKLLRNLNVIDILVQILKYPIENLNEKDLWTTLFGVIFDIMETYLMGKSRKNKQYIVRYVEFFQAHFIAEKSLGLKVATLLVELIRGNRKILDKITFEQIDSFISQFRSTRNFCYLDLLNVTCVCDDVAISDNQLYIAQEVLRTDPTGLYFTNAGDSIAKDPEVVYISFDQQKNWIDLPRFANKKAPGYNPDRVKFFIHQLEFIYGLCYGQNEEVIKMITVELEFFTWKEVFLCLQCDMLPDTMRAMYCDLLNGLFVEGSVNKNALNFNSKCFVYEEITMKEEQPSSSSLGLLVESTRVQMEAVAVNSVTVNFFSLRQWMAEFLNANTQIITSQIGHNILLERVLRLLHRLITYGHYGSSHDNMNDLHYALMNILDGESDMPLPIMMSDMRTEARQLLKKFKREKFEKSAETNAVVNAKYRALEVVELILVFQFREYMQTMLATFKLVENGLRKSAESDHHPLQPLLSSTFQPLDSSRKATKQRRQLTQFIQETFERVTVLNTEEFTRVILDLTHYKYDNIVTKALDILDKYFSSKRDVFKALSEAQLLLTEESCNINKELDVILPILRQLTKTKLTEDRTQSICQDLDKLISYCTERVDTSKPHIINQHILISNDVLSVMLDLLSSSGTNLEQHPGVRSVIVRAIKLLRALCKGNEIVQKRIFDCFDTVLRVQGLENDAALLLRDAFVGNLRMCLKAQPRHAERVTRVMTELCEQVPELVELLCVIVKVSGPGIPLRRNQTFVMKAVMRSFVRTGDCFSQSREYRIEVLRGQHGPMHPHYMAALVSLLSSCAEGDNRLAHSMCKTLLPVDEVLQVLGLPGVDNNVKKPYMYFMHTVYLASLFEKNEIGTAELAHNPLLWKYLQKLMTEIVITTKFAKERPEVVGDLLNTTLLVGKPVEKSNQLEVMCANLHFILDAVLPFLSTYVTRFYTVDQENHPEEVGVIKLLANALRFFGDVIKPYLISGQRIKSLLTTVVILVASSTLSHDVAIAVIDSYKSVEWGQERSKDAGKTFIRYYADELDVNKLFRRFLLNASLLYGGSNTVAEQLQISSRWANKKEYTNIRGKEALPLGSYFQDHVRAFIQPELHTLARQYALFGSLMNQLRASTEVGSRNEASRLNQERLNVKCLQLLRAVIHNEMVKLPDDWKDNYEDHSATLKRIGALQKCFIDMKVIQSAMPMLGSSNDDIVREALCLITCLMFNANRLAQSESLKYFHSTRQEAFFSTIKNCMTVSIAAYKESRVMNMWSLGKVNELEILAKRKRLKLILMNVREVKKEISEYDRGIREEKKKLALIFPVESFEEQQKMAHRRKSALSQPAEDDAKSATANKKKQRNRRESTKFVNNKALLIEPKKEKERTAVFDELNALSMDDELEMKIIQPNGDGVSSLETTSVVPSDALSAISDGTRDATVDDMAIPDGGKDEDDEESLSAGPGNLELVMKIIAQMCDGQNRALQDYLRDQPDNIKSINLVIETVAVLSTLYTDINPDTIEIVTNVFDSLNEMTQGNQLTRDELVQCKIIDYINVIIRTGSYPSCEEEQVIELKNAIGVLIRSLIEENGPAELETAQDIKDQLDMDAVVKLIVSCYEGHRVKKPRFADLKQTREECGCANTGKVLRNFATKTTEYIKQKISFFGQSDIKAALEDMGFLYYLIMRRMFDLDPELQKKYTHHDAPGSTSVITPEQRKAFAYYQQHCQTVEIMKDDVVQKINFRVKNASILREEVKENIKWNVDRSSPSEKLRDFFLWYKDIQSDLRYQNKVLSNVFMTFVTRYWLLWCYICMFLSVIINLFMLITWQAQLSMNDIDTDDWPPHTPLPDALYYISPKVPDYAFFQKFIYIIGGIHNFFSFLVFIGYFMANNPQVSGIKQIFQAIKNFFSGTKSVAARDESSGVRVDSRVAVQVLSMKTFYYAIFLVFSVLGTVYEGYFFCFHLLNIMSTNALLGGVIKSITRNAQSLIWVAILGMVVIYIYAVAEFAFLRDMFDNADNMFCGSLAQCYVTMLRHGLLGTYNDKFYRAENAPGDGFTNFFLNSLCQITFFIVVTTIGLNIIFGIILDTFSELRDIKWTAENDMRDYCFICSINSYIFESRSNGFRRHIKQDHNMWSYMYFMLQLSVTDPNDFTALELYCWNLMKKENLDFFPMNRSLVLTNEKEDETDTKLDDLTEKVDLIVKQMKENENLKQRKRELKEQKRWQQKHKRADAAFSVSDATRALPKPQDGDAAAGRGARRRSSSSSSESDDDVEVRRALL